MTYTTVENIQRRLRGWASTTPAAAFSETEVETTLIQQLIDQACGRINDCLRDRYTVPIPGDQPSLQSCAEKLVLCELLTQMYAGTTPSNRGSFRSTMCAEGKAELAALKSIFLDVPAASTAALRGTPEAGERNLPNVYKECGNCGCDTTADKIKPIQW